MRPLAEFIMRGRVEAVLVAYIGLLVPIVAQASVFVVCLRKGLFEGAIVALWVSLPYVLTLWMGTGEYKLVAYIVIGSLIVGLFCAEVLRLSRNWQWLLVALVVVSAVFGIGAVLFDIHEGFLALLQDSAKAVSQADMEPIGQGGQKVSGFVAMWVALWAVLGMVVARYWQAMLYNPGGFREEFHQLRLGPGVAALLAVIVVAATVLKVGDFWLIVISMPALFAGLALCHSLFAMNKSGSVSIALLYASLVLVPYMSSVLALLGIGDAFINVRNKFNSKPN